MQQVLPFFLIFTLVDANVYSDAIYSSVLSSIPGITFVSSTPSMAEDTSVYFSSFAWPANRTAQQQDYVSVPVATMAMCLAVQPYGAINVTKAPTMQEIGDLLLGVSDGATWLRSDMPEAHRVSHVYWAASSSAPLLNALETWVGASFSTFSSTVSQNAATTILPTDADVATALAADASAVAFLPLIAAVQAKMACLSITTPTASGGSVIVEPELLSTSSTVITVSSSSLAVTCPVAAGCYPIVGALVAHVRKRTSMSVCAEVTSQRGVITTFVSSSSSIAAPMSRWSMLFPPVATQFATLQTLTASACMPETVVLEGVGGVLRQSALNDWFYQYFIATNGTVFVNYTSTSSTDAVSLVQNGKADFVSGSALTATDRATYPTLHSFPSLAASMSLIVNIGHAASVRLPRCSITSIFNGTIQWWNDTAIQAVNALTVMPQRRITVAVRTEPSQATEVFMAGLRALDEACYGVSSIPPTALLPTVSSDVRFVGNDPVVNYVVSTPYTITWTPFDYAKTRPYLNQAKVQGDDGSVTLPSDTQTSLDGLDGGVFDPTTSDYDLASLTTGYPFVGIHCPTRRAR